MEPLKALHVEHLVVGAGVSGLAYANAVREGGARIPSVLVVEREHEPGGYCRTVVQDGFTWDYSGHFFHFKHKDIEAWLLARMPPASTVTVHKRSLVRACGVDVDFPFQKNIHQLPRADFLDCLVDLFEAHEAQSTSSPPETSFKSMVLARFGRGIAERFLIPYNEKLYACDLDALDKDAMGRFFPHANLHDVIRNFRAPDNGGYNATFTYPKGGAIEYIRALLHDLPEGTVSLGESLVHVDLDQKCAVTTSRTITFDHLVTSAPLPALLRACDVPHDVGAFSWNRVLVFNLGFDSKGPRDVHWMYFPDRALAFYRVGFYDNIFDVAAADDDVTSSAGRMSLYVEVGLPATGAIDVTAWRARVLADLASAGIVTTQQLVAEHHVVMDPAYVHITQRSLHEATRTHALLEAHGVHAIGRYGAWTYCSIEDNIVEARALAARLR